MDAEVPRGKAETWCHVQQCTCAVWWSLKISYKRMAGLKFSNHNKHLFSTVGSIYIACGDFM